MMFQFPEYDLLILTSRDWIVIFGDQKIHRKPREALGTIAAALAWSFASSIYIKSPAIADVFNMFAGSNTKFR
jgi:hypothetical protein